MPGVVKYAFLLALALPMGFVGYHLAADRSGGAGAREASIALSSAMAELGLGGGHSLADLDVLKHDFYFVEQRYVEKDRLDPEAMFDGALDRVEREFNEVLFVREPRGRRLSVTVGAYSTVLLLNPIDSLDALTGELQRVAAILDEHLPPDVSRPEVEYAFINGALATLDPHSVVLPPEAAREMDVDNQGEFGGLGIEITVKDGMLIVKQPLEGTPAARAGIRAGDHIVRIEDISTINMDLDEAVSLLRGEVGTPVTITVRRKQLDEPRSYTIRRAVIQLNPVEGELLDGGVGYVRIKSFHANVASDLEGLLARLHREAGGELRGLVLDLRSNPGGYLNQAWEVANKFLDDGIIVTTVEGAGRRRDEQPATAQGTEPDYPMAVLVNGNSASASEIVAGALRNLNRAVVIGERTFGKGSVQHLYNNKDRSKLKLTVAKYLTPGDRSIQSVGIPPDILLEPSYVRPAGEGDEDLPRASLFWWRWVDREVDLDHHLDDEHAADGRPAYTLRFLLDRPLDDDAEPGPRQDWEVGFARDVLLAAAGRAHRVEVLEAARPVVRSRAEREERELVAAFEAIGIDWTRGPNPDRARLDVSVQVGEDGALPAGEEGRVTVRVRNLGEAPLYRLMALTASSNPWLDRRELFFGRLEPGATGTARLDVRVHPGYGDEVADLSLVFQDDEEHELARHEDRVAVRGRPLPRLAWSLELRDDGSEGSRGDGDGRPEPGERVALGVRVRNVGEGPTGDAFVRVRNESGRALDLERGIAHLGRPVGDGPCEEDCERVMEPGESDEAWALFDLRDAPEDGWAVEVLVGDNERYDYAAVQRAGFFDAFQQKQRVVLRPGEAVDGHERVPPAIEVARSPGLESASEEAVISGMVSDDAAVDDVVIYHGDTKVFYRGGGEGVRMVPFSVDLRLEPGANLVTVLARDADGLVSSRVVDTWYEPPEETARATP